MRSEAKEKEVRRTEHFSAAELRRGRGGGGGFPWGAFVVSLKLTLELARGTISLTNHLFICFSLRKIIAFFRNMVECMTTEYRATIFFSYLARRNMVREAPR